MAFSKEKLRKLPHFLNGIIILLHAYERFEEGHHTYPIFLVAGLVFLGLAIFHHQVVHRLPWADTVFYAIEGLLALVIAAEYIHAGKKLLPIPYVLAGVLQIFIVIPMVKRKNKTHT